MPRGPFVEERHDARPTPRRTATRSPRPSSSAAAASSSVARCSAGCSAAGWASSASSRSSRCCARSGRCPRARSFTPTGARAPTWSTRPGGASHVGDLAVGSIVTVFPEGTQNTDRGQAVDQTVLIRISNEDFVTQKGRETWAPAGLRRLLQALHPPGLPGRALRAAAAAAGLPVPPVDVRRHQRRASRTSVRRRARCPSCRSTSTRAGYLRAQSDYDQPVGPGFWERSVSDVVSTKRAQARGAAGPTARSARSSTSSTTAWASPRAAAPSSTRSSPTTGRSCSARSRCTRSSSCWPPASS